MGDLSQANALGRFTGLASSYAAYRPSYPTDAVEFIIRHCELNHASTLVDVGAGTGISSRLFAERGIPVIAIEPNTEMRRKGASEEPSTGAANITFRGGSAEATGLAAESADAVLAAQAFHWFQAETALSEFHRILKPGGWLVLLWNERDETDPFTAAYGDVIRTAPDTAAVEGPRGQAGEVLLTHRLFCEAERVTFANQQVLDEEGVLGRAFSASYAPLDPREAATFAESLRRVFGEYQRDGSVALRYLTSVYIARSRK
jgi:SAM-dependent methyltransferase